MTDRYSQRVAVYTAAGVMLRRASADEALDLRRHGAQVRLRRRGQVRELTLPVSPGPPVGPPSPASIATYQGQRYAVRESVCVGDQVVGHCHTFRRIHPGDRDLFQLALTDCGAELVRR